MPARSNRRRARDEDVPYTMRLPDGRTLLVLVPAAWCEADVSGDMAFGPRAVRLLDQVRALAMRTPHPPTPGFVRTLREALGMTQAAMAEALGVDKMTVARWEWGKVKPSAAAAEALDHLRRRLGRKGIVIAA